MVTEKYRALIDRFPLVPIKNDAHLDEAHEVAQALMLRGDVASDEAEYLEVLLDEIAHRSDLKRLGAPNVDAFVIQPVQRRQLQETYQHIGHGHSV